MLGIDEHFFSARKRFATTFCDLKKRRIFDVAAGRSHADLQPYLHDLKSKNRVRIVCMDLSESYRSIARSYFPAALVVADRFHVVRLALHHLMKTCRQIDPELTHRTRRAAGCCKSMPATSPSRRPGGSKPISPAQPAIAAIYDFKEELMAVLTAKRPDQGRVPHPRPSAARCASANCAESPFEDCRKLGRTLDNWQVEIGRMWRFSRSNGITEGFHRKMKLIQRRAFGFRNFENYRRRVRALCA